MTIAAEVDAHTRAVAMIRSRLTSLLAHSWDRLPTYNDSEPFLRIAVPLVLAAQKHTVTVTDAYLARVLTQITGAPHRPVGVDASTATGAAVRAGASPDEVYRRPFVTVWSGLKSGQQWVDAVAAGKARMLSTATMDVALAQRATMADVSEQTDGIVGYRRVITGNACQLCVDASGQFYYSGDLMPIHNNCDCSVMPVTRQHDPAHSINARLRPEITVTSLSDDGSLSTHKGFEVHAHGELGPVLTVAGQHFTGPDDIAA